jgi:DNA-binding LytR/AlgR family response regulator
LWLFLDCLIGASLFSLIKQKFNLLSENLNSVSRDLLILVAAAPLVRNGIAYLLKPFSFEKFAAAMRKFETLKQNFAAATQRDVWLEIGTSFAAPKYKERLVVKVKGGVRLLETRQIAFVKTQNEIVFGFSENGSKYPLKETLAELEQILDPRMFFRTSRSEIVNLDFIERLEPDYSDRLVVRLKNLQARLVSSTSRTPGLRKWLENS